MFAIFKMLFNRINKNKIKIHITACLYTHKDYTKIILYFVIYI